MKTHRTLTSEIRENYPALGFIFVIAGFFLAVVIYAHWWRNIPLGDLTRDPADVMNFPFYVGFLSDIGVLFMSAAAALCFFSAHLVSMSKLRSGWGGFLYASGAFSLLLTLDDLFMLHDEVFPQYFRVPEGVVYGAYFILGLLYLVRYWRFILSGDRVLFGCAVLFLGMSVMLDAFPLPNINPFLFEDGAKFVGIVGWLTYFTRVSSQALQRMDL